MPLTPEEINAIASEVVRLINEYDRLKDQERHMATHLSPQERNKILRAKMFAENRGKK